MRVSIVMPVRNAAAWLEATLHSVFEQTLRDFELIAVNDHSDDDSLQILAAWAQREPRLSILQNRGTGLVAALNTGMERANAEFVARMDADDLMPANRLELQENFLSTHPDATLVSGRVEHWGDASTAGYSRYVDFINTLRTPDDYRLKQFIESPLAHPSVMLRRSALPEEPYRDGDFPEDYDLWLRLLAGGAEFHSLSEVVLKWRDHPRRTSRVDTRYDIEKFYRHKATFIADWLKSRGHTAITAWAGGRRSRRRIDALRGAGIEIRGYVDVHPRRVGQKIDGVAVISPEKFSKSGGGFMVVYVGSRGARESIWRWLGENSFKEGIDFLFAA